MHPPTTHSSAKDENNKLQDKWLDLAEQLFQVMDAEINLEDRINDEVRVLLNQYQEQMRQSGASYQEMFKLIKNKLVRERKLVL